MNKDKNKRFALSPYLSQMKVLNRKNLSSNVLLGIIFLLFLPFLVAALVGLGIRRDDLQLVFFPFVALAMLLCLKQGLGFSIKKPVILSFLFFWLFVLASVRGIFDIGFMGASAHVARLNGDPQGYEMQRLIRSVNTVSNAYGLKEVRALQRLFPDDKHALEWLKRNETSSLLASGNALSMKVHISPQVISSNNLPFSDLFSGGGSFLELPKAHAGSRSLLIAEEEFYLAGVPKYFNLPTEPEHLFSHFMAWFVEGISRFKELPQGWARQGRALAAREMLYRAAEVDGYWKSHEPHSMARYLVAMSFLVSNSAESLYREETECALREFALASGLLIHRANPELAAAIFNNAAVAKLLYAKDERDLEKAEQWFEKALFFKTSEGNPVFASHAALSNLSSLARASLR